jgi:hypothetical protein
MAKNEECNTIKMLGRLTSEEAMAGRSRSDDRRHVVLFYATFIMASYAHPTK